MKTNNKIFGRFSRSQEISIGNRTASSVKDKGGNNMANKAKMSTAAGENKKEETKMKTSFKGKARFFKEATSFVSSAFKAGWNGEEFDAEKFVEERGYDTLLTDEAKEAKAKAAEDTSKAARKEKETKEFHDSLGEPSKPKDSEEETPPVKEEKESDVVEETTHEPEETPEVTDEAEVTEEETPEVAEETEVTEEETPAGGKVRPAAVKVSKLVNHIGKFGAAGVRRVKGGYQRVKGKVQGLAAKSSFKKNIRANAKMLWAGILGMYSGLILGINSLYAFGLLTMILSLRVVLPVVLILGLLEAIVFGLKKYNSFIVKETLSSLKGVFAEKAKEEANA